MPHTWGPKAGHQFTRAGANESQPQPAAAGPPPKARVLFVCIGNSCRSQMAEGFARKYGGDVMASFSAGLAPATLIAPLTRKVMLEGKQIDMAAQFPKSVYEVPGPFDLIVNISGEKLPPQIRAAQFRTWQVDDPVAGAEAVHREAAEKIEYLVQQLILELRARNPVYTPK